MKHAIIVAHPNADSFNLTMARAYQKAAEQAGGQCVLRDLYRIGFDPRLAASEIPWSSRYAIGDDVKVERALIDDADVFVFVYPLWFNTPPAMMKGYMERVFSMDFGFASAEGVTQPLLSGRSMVSISSSGAPDEWVHRTGSWDALRKLYDEHFGEVCGLAVTDHLHFGGITPGITRQAVRDCEAQVAKMVKTHFGSAQPTAA